MDYARKTSRIGVCFAAAAVAASAGLAVAAGEQAKSAGDPIAAAQAEALRQAVRATFVQMEDGAPGKFLPEPIAKPARVAAAWDRAKPKLTNEERTTKVPSFYIYDAAPVKMIVDTTRIAVKFAGVGAGVTDEQVAAAAQKLGIGVRGISGPSIANWRFIDLAAPLNDATAVSAAIDLLLTDPVFEFASPIFHHATIEGGYYVVTPEINIRVTQANAVNAEEALRAAAPDAEIVSSDLGGLLGAFQVKIPDHNGFRVLRAANLLWEHPSIAWAEPDAISTMKLDYTPNDDLWGSGTWGWEQNNDIDTDAVDAWDLTRGSSSVRVLVMDCGAEQTHPDLNQNAGRDFTTGAAGGIAGGGPAGNCDRHGTSVAGIISGRINNGIGGAGVCPNCRVLSAKTAVEDTSPCASTYASFSSSWLANAINWGDGQGAVITNSSFGVGSSSTSADAYDNAKSNGMTHFASAGNGGNDNIGDPTLGYPSSLDSVEAVAAIDSDGGRSNFSNYGNGLQFSCPGTGVRTSDRQGTLGYNSSSGTNGNYTTFGGTSAASPFCAGVCALLTSAFPDLPPASILSLMKTGARDLGASGYDTGYGWGFPNVNTSLRIFRSGDWCDTATTISTWSYDPSPYATGGANEVADEHQESCELNNAGVSHSRWYTFVPPCTGTLNINTNGSNYDTVLSVWRGNCLSATQVACDDDSGAGTQSQLTDVAVTAGFTYFVKVSAYGLNNAGGTLDFNFEYVPSAPANDNCSDATSIFFSAYNTTRCTFGATTSACDHNDSCEAGGNGTSKSVWWQFTPGVNGRMDIDTNDSDYDTVLSVWTGCPLALSFNGQFFCLAGNEIACDDDSGTGLDSMVTGVNIRKGSTYRIKVSGYGANNSGGDLHLHFQFRRCPADHNQSGAVSVQDLFDFLTDYFAGNLAADYDNSDSVSLQDIFDYLALFFEGECV